MYFFLQFHLFKTFFLCASASFIVDRGVSLHHALPRGVAGQLDCGVGGAEDGSPSICLLGGGSSSSRSVTALVVEKFLLSSRLMGNRCGTGEASWAVAAGVDVSSSIWVSEQPREKQLGSVEASIFDGDDRKNQNNLYKYIYRTIKAD